MTKDRCGVEGVNPLPLSRTDLARLGTVLSIATVNVNGIRAAFRRGMGPWLENHGADIITLQEVRAPDSIVQEYLSDDWNMVHTEAADKGRAGVAIITKLPMDNVRIGIGDEYFDTSGRWAEADITTPSGEKVTVISAYVHSGEVDTQKQVDKYRFMDEMTARLGELAATGNHVVITGDLNVGHTELDIKNWKGNVKNAGFLPEERAYFDKWLADGTWTDIGRKLAGEVPGPYTWWSYRGKAFDNDAGWRIDYQLATAELASKAQTAVVDRAETYDTRWSDHAPLIVEYDL